MDKRSQRAPEVRMNKIGQNMVVHKDSFAEPAANCGGGFSSLAQRGAFADAGGSRSHSVRTRHVDKYFWILIPAALTVFTSGV